ncbi:MAG: SUMF1/EgtB/PvdO family nonheme iron enzyme [Arenicellales bacterium]
MNEQVEKRLGVHLSENAAEVFLLRSGGLWATSDELVVLLGPSSQPTSDWFVKGLLTAAVEEAQGCAVVSIIRDAAAPPLSQVDDLPYECHVRSPQDFMRRVSPLPAEFSIKLQEVSGIQRPDGFRQLFQQRQAIVARSPRSRVSPVVVDLDKFLQTWLGEHLRPNPILLIGERGAGKTWQLLHFAQHAHALHLKDPWRYGPAFFVRLRELASLAVQASAARTPLVEYVLRKYFEREKLPIHGSFLSALFSIGHAVVCLDGLDEIEILPTNEQVHADFLMLLSLVSRRTKFVVTSRTGHFGSLRSLVALGDDNRHSVGALLEVLEILPFDRSIQTRYVSKAVRGAPTQQKLSELLGLIETGGDDSSLREALSMCAAHPALLAHITERVEEGVSDALTILADAIVSVLIEHNVHYGRTSEEYHPVGGGWVDLSVEKRVQLLGEIAWYMAERRLGHVRLARLPERLYYRHGLVHEAIRRDLRSQMAMVPVHEREEASGTQASQMTLRAEQTGPGDTAAEPAEDAVQFGIRGSAATADGINDLSAAGAYFLALHVVERIMGEIPFGPLPPASRLAAVGRVPIDRIAAGIVRNMLCSRTGPQSLRELGRDAWKQVRKVAAGGGFRIYEPAYRYLAENLCRIGCITEREANLLTPWTSATTSVVRPPKCAADYHLVVICPRSKGPSSEEEKKAFLLGVHEVTNALYLNFIQSSRGSTLADPTVDGQQWAVTRMTSAGSRETGNASGPPISPNHVLSNEYHLFYWLPQESSRNGAYFTPAPGQYSHPVTWISWFGAAAFCDWLSLGDSEDRHYVIDLFGALGRDPRTAKGAGRWGGYGYRLPTLSEWTWSARAGYEDVCRPWEAYPYYLPRDQRPLLQQSGSGHGGDEGSAKWAEAFRVEQEALRDVLLKSGKESRPVMYDEFNDLGLSGMIGNVREWCHDHPDMKRSAGGGVQDYRLILGATAYLGERTFDFEYSTSLYPRNTNPDVGFRAARSLRPEEIETLRTRQREVEGLPEEPVDGAEPG